MSSADCDSVVTSISRQSQLRKIIHSIPCCGQQMPKASPSHCPKISVWMLGNFYLARMYAQRFHTWNFDLVSYHITVWGLGKILAFRGLGSDYDQSVVSVAADDSLFIAPYTSSCSSCLAIIISNLSSLQPFPLGFNLLLLQLALSGSNHPCQRYTINCPFQYNALLKP